MTEKIERSIWEEDSVPQLSMVSVKLLKSNAEMKNKMVLELISIGIPKEAIARILNLKLNVDPL